MPDTEQCREQRARRRLAPQGRRLIKSRSTQRLWGGPYLVVDANRNWLLSPETGMDLDQVEA
jgi:hypothetical protein